MRHGGILGSSIETARETARKCGTCPLRVLDDWLFERWDVVSLCREFACVKCVAEPGEWEPEGIDEGFGGETLEEVELAF